MQMIGRTRIKNSSTKNGNRSERGDFLIKKQPAKLYLSDGVKFDGFSLTGEIESCTGEVVFNTGMTGYVESLTDPSYANQILVFTYPMIGNYGVQLGDTESPKLQVSGVIVSQLALEGSHEDSTSSLIEWLSSQGIPLLSGVDTRALTKHLRTRGTMLGGFSTKKLDTSKIVLGPNPKVIDKPITYNSKGKKSVILVDCGAKDNILQSLIGMDLKVLRVPSDYDYTSEKYDGVVLSNGPGDPTDYPETIAVARQALKGKKPVFGICLGNQIMALAAGAKTYKLPFGHRGHNQPCMELETERCFITSQNHGYAIDEKSMPKDWVVSFRNLNDKSVEGIRHKTKPFFSVQFHPEACPGPTDTEWLFDKFGATL